MNIVLINDGFEFHQKNIVILRHTTTEPAFYVGIKNLDIHMDKGEFQIHDQTEYTPCILDSIQGSTIRFHQFSLKVVELDGNSHIQFLDTEEPIKIKLLANKSEQIYGLGEHFTSLNLRGHIVKNWVEEHITRKQIYNKIFRRLLKMKPKKWKFEEYKTYFIIPSFISSKNYFCHIESSGYGTFDFCDEDYHEITFVSPIKEMVLSFQGSLLDTSSKLCQFHGIMPKLPDWIYDGMILGLQGGTETVNNTVMSLLDLCAKINGIWSQDWRGELFTYFGKQVLWNWSVDEKLYPNLKTSIQEWKKTNINFLSYINPYLNANESMFLFAKEQDFLVKDEQNEVFLTQATSFQFGIVDLTNPKAYQWFKTIIKENYLDLGIMGWMADFGEYLPTKCVLYSGSGEELHNAWPDLWIQLNKEVLEENNMLSKAIFFNRAGYSNNTKYSTLIWNGDQHVDFTDDFGMKSVVRAALSLSLSGVGISHSDVGGYTTVPGIKRSEELYLRWLEMNTFSPVLRSHEGNKPWSNIQSYSNIKTMKATAKFSNIHVLLKPYLKFVENEYQEHHHPMIRPTFMYFEYFSESTYFLGEDLYVCPVLNKRKNKQMIDILSDGWIHLFTGKEYAKGKFSIECPLGTPPVFYKKDSDFKDLFQKITEYIGDYK
ncbi:MAG: alpha-glucosidase [Firmicutes bacterium]|nr:alpha-glucosidase [Bacillota bacterium]